jgi:putative transposase
MQLVERHAIKRADPRFAAIDRAAFAARNLYKAANYVARQALIHEGIFMGYAEVFHGVRDHEVYCALPRKMSNDVLRQFDMNWRPFFQALAARRANPSNFPERPRLPGYMDKRQGRHLLVYDIQALGVLALRHGLVAPSMLGVSIPPRHQDQHTQQARMVSRHSFYVVEVVNEQPPTPAAGNSALRAGADIGPSNMTVLASDKPCSVPRIVDGRPVKSINQLCNQRRAQLQGRFGTVDTSRRLERITTERTRRTEHHLHTSSRHIKPISTARTISSAQELLLPASTGGEGA